MLLPSTVQNQEQDFSKCHIYQITKRCYLKRNWQKAKWKHKTSATSNNHDKDYCVGHIQPSSFWISKLLDYSHGLQVEASISFTAQIQSQKLTGNLRFIKRYTEAFELDKAVVLVWLDWLVFCEYGFSVSALWCPLATPTILLGFLLPWTWGISSWLLQQSAAAAPYLGRGVSPHRRPSRPWTWKSSYRPSGAHATTAPWTWGWS